ncbi:hypothetical protein FBU30_008492 [Linnemannia zychae]|nr:hypothetical protein FBU30_008492 [Linnemannia zychae]
MNRIPPEVLLQISTKLDTNSCFACRQVCHYWADAFIPACWRTLNQLHSPWRQIMRAPSPIYPPEENELCISRARSLLERYGSHIRELTIGDDLLLDASIKARLTRLESLVIYGLMNEYVCEQESAFMTVEGPPRFTSFATDLDATWPIVPAQTVFNAQHPSPGPISRTQGCWQLIMNNPELRRLEFKGRTGITIVPFDSHPHCPTLMTPDSINFLDKVLSRLPHLTHIAIAQPAADYIFVNLSRYQNITSFVCPNTSNPAISLSEQIGSTTLQRLVLRRWIDGPSLFTLGRLFPQLRELTLGIVDINQYYRADVSNTDPSPFSNLEYLCFSDIRDINSISRAGIHFPAVKKIGPTIKFRSLSYIWILLKTFPALEYLDAMETLSAGLRYGDILDPTPLKPSSDLRLTTLILSHGVGRFQARICEILEIAPSLSYLELGLIFSSTIETLTKHCNQLEYLRFNIERGTGHKELHQLFIACPNLKRLRGKGHEIVGEDFIQNHAWSCTTLQELDLSIVNIPRMNETQEHVWEAMLRQNKSVPETDEELEAVTQRKHSHLFQRSVYENLAKYTHLRHLNMSCFDNVPSGLTLENLKLLDHDSCRATFACLEFTVESGLEILARIPRLEVIGVGRLDHRITTRDLQWMCDQWPLKRVEGLEYLRSDPADKNSKDVFDRVKISMMVSGMLSANK